jgi:predicted DsbA family dithiol-disulfide isomerase
MQAVQVEIHYDFICPWCWIGQQDLAAAHAAPGIGEAVSIYHVPFEGIRRCPSRGWTGAAIELANLAVGLVPKAWTRRLRLPV